MTGGVYIQEITTPPPIAPASTSAAAFVGAAPGGRANAPRLVRSYAAFELAFGPSPAGDLADAVRLFFLNGGAQAWIVRPARTRAGRRLALSQSLPAALQALDRAAPVDILVLPGLTDPGLQSAGLAYAQSRRAMLILDAPPDAAAWLAANPSLQSPDAAAYWPRLLVSDPGQPTPRPAAGSGAVAGVWARTASSRGVWKAPAGADAALAGAVGLEVQPTTTQVEDTNRLRINALRRFPPQPPLVWGARTLAGADGAISDYKYLPVRRMALFLEKSLQPALKWAMFEPGGEPLWAAVRLQVGAFLHDLFRKGAFQGQTPREAYFVNCDRDTHPASAPGELVVVIGFAPLKPAEFVVLTLRAKAAPPL